MDVYNRQFLDSLTSLLRFEILTVLSLNVSSTSCRHFDTTLLSSSDAEDTNSNLPQLSHTGTKHQQPLKHPGFAYTAFQHSPV